MTGLFLKPLSDLMGAEVADFDCRQPPDAPTREAIMDALYAHQVLVFRNQK